MTVYAYRMLDESLIPCGVAGVLPCYVMEIIATVGRRGCVSLY